jgi:hypothetical protein
MIFLLLTTQGAALISSASVVNAYVRFNGMEPGEIESIPVKAAGAKERQGKMQPSPGTYL